jgi:hypothetical protein
MKRHVTGGVCLLLVSTWLEATPVYRCEQEGVVTFTDRPCAAQAPPHDLPQAVIIGSPTAVERDLARRHDERIRKGKAVRDREDARWLKEYQAREDREQRVRDAILAREVIRGMTADEVHRALGRPDRVARSQTHGTPKETWTWRDERGTRTVNFKDGEVTSTSLRRKSSK